MTTGVPRRNAIVGGVVVLAGAIAGFVYGRHSDAAKRPKAQTNDYGGGGGGNGGGQLLAPLAKVPAGGGLITSGVVLLRNGASVHALSAKCTHLGCTVNRVDGGKIYCPCHGSVFDAVTGKPIQGPASTPLPTVQVTVRDGNVYTA